jgi:hypothetical protein
VREDGGAAFVRGAVVVAGESSFALAGFGFFPASCLVFVFGAPDGSSSFEAAVFVARTREAGRRAVEAAAMRR